MFGVRTKRISIFGERTGKRFYFVPQAERDQLAAIQDSGDYPETTVLRRNTIFMRTHRHYFRSNGYAEDKESTHDAGCDRTAAPQGKGNGDGRHKSETRTAGRSGRCVELKAASLRSGSGFVYRRLIGPDRRQCHVSCSAFVRVADPKRHFQ
ncbi:hypothetical protein GWI33_017126 [Rhynchophorus ferrugineus]|uniref:Uncharacterized protein n=1 Tax=Rhynchophorus ferrugineus TaxID=354439 RepID=A0A834I2J4_RHYFE|nr:hypothetical protein GWI33_017126 [Rhynchophorus ferrugineus]